MNRVFADANFWIARFNPRDQLHESAKAAAALLGKARIVTTDEVLTEFLNHFSNTTAPFGHGLSRRHEGKSSILIPLAVSVASVFLR
jgi:predicted nucleic acid-binding protein